MTVEIKTDPVPVHLVEYVDAGTSVRVVCNGEDKTPFQLYPTWSREHSTRIERVTCPACIDAWETKPVLVTTEDMVELVKLLGAIAGVIVPLNDQGASVLRRVRDLEARLARPRRKP